MKCGFSDSIYYSFGLMKIIKFNLILMKSNLFFLSGQPITSSRNISNLKKKYKEILQPTKWCDCRLASNGHFVECDFFPVPVDRTIFKPQFRNPHMLRVCVWIFTVKTFLIQLNTCFAFYKPVSTDMESASIA